MGTNYYAEVDVCPHCKRPAREFHIGKNSMGWEFHFQGYCEGEDAAPFPLKSWKDYRSFLSMPDVQIRNDYGDVLTLDEFAELVNGTKGRKNHLDYCQIEHPDYAKSLWQDDEGFCFGYGEFS